MVRLDISPSLLGKLLFSLPSTFRDTHWHSSCLASSLFTLYTSVACMYGSALTSNRPHRGPARPTLHLISDGLKASHPSYLPSRSLLSITCIPVEGRNTASS
jgi:hypothetical protein